jgi:hypothetical protein
METQAFLMIAMPVLMGLVAIGAVLAIKITRRRQASGHATDDVATAVPATPMSSQHANRLWRRYGAGAGAILIALAVLAAGFALAWN